MKVFVVTVGSYSDYRIDRVFADESAAEAYAALRSRRGWDEPQVEAYEVEAAVPAQRTVYQCWQRFTWPNHLSALEERSWVAFDGDTEYGYVRPRVAVTPVETVGWAADGWNTVTVTCTDRDLARKALHDRMAGILAAAAGL